MGHMHTYTYTYMDSSDMYSTCEPHPYEMFSKAVLETQLCNWNTQQLQFLHTTGMLYLLRSRHSTSKHWLPGSLFWSSGRSGRQGHSFGVDRPSQQVVWFAALESYRHSWREEGREGGRNVEKRKSSHRYTWTIHEPHLPGKKSSPRKLSLCKTCFSQYQTSSAVLGRPGNGNCKCSQVASLASHMLWQQDHSLGFLGDSAIELVSSTKHLQETASHRAETAAHRTSTHHLQKETTDVLS